MKKTILPFLIALLTIIQLSAQKEAVTQTIRVFPYQRTADAEAAINTMQSWNKNNWGILLSMLDDDSLKLKASYALSACVNQSANIPEKKKSVANILSAWVSSLKTYYAKELVIKYLGLLGDESAIKPLSLLLTDETLADNAARALAAIHSNASIAALNKALNTAKDAQKKNIQSALDNVNKALPQIKEFTPKDSFVNNPVQTLLGLENQMDAAKNPIQKKSILAAASHIPGLGSFMFVSKFLNDADLANDAASICARLAIADKTIFGPVVREALEKAGKLIKGEDSAILVKKLSAHLKAMPYDNGFISLFNGKDLSGWKALVGNPISRSKMSGEELQNVQNKAEEKTKGDWIVKDGLLIFTGHGDNLATTKQYSDVEMYVDWKITEKGDAGIYLRGSPQVQIWDTSRREVGAQVGSGGLYNNEKNPKNPLVVADNKIGEWNQFHIIMKGEKVTVYLNGQLVTDNVIMLPIEIFICASYPQTNRLY